MILGSSPTLPPLV
ncbi:hypothetical protein LINPERHAP1_LOCUS22427 [Linum perenne]